MQSQKENLRHLETPWIPRWKDFASQVMKICKCQLPKPALARAAEPLGANAADAVKFLGGGPWGLPPGGGGGPCYFHKKKKIKYVYSAAHYARQWISDSAYSSDGIHSQEPKYTARIDTKDRVESDNFKLRSKLNLLWQS